MSLADDLESLVDEHGWRWSRVAAHYGVSEREVRRWRDSPPERAERLPRPSVLDWTTTYVLSDLQYPYHDRDLLEVAVDIVADLQPDAIAWNGDILDLPQLSRWTTNPYVLDLARDDVERFHRDVRTPLLEAAGDVVETFVKGNHEDRDRRYITSQAPAFAGFVSSRAFLMLPDEVDLYEYGKGIGPVLPGGLLVNHGWRAQAHSAYSAKNSVADVGISVLLGHTHRLGHYATRTFDPRAQQWTTWHGYEMGHMADEETVPKATEGIQDWQQCAGAVVRSRRDGSTFSVDLLPVDGHRWVHVGDRVYEVERSRPLWRTS